MCSDFQRSLYLQLYVMCVVIHGYTRYFKIVRLKKHIIVISCELRLGSLGNLEAAVSLLLSTPPEG
jgi:hypothetical protein